MQLRWEESPAWDTTCRTAPNNRQHSTVIKKKVMIAETRSAWELVDKGKKCSSLDGSFYIVHYAVNKNNNIGKNKLETDTYNRIWLGE